MPLPPDHVDGRRLVHYLAQQRVGCLPLSSITVQAVSDARWVLATPFPSMTLNWTGSGVPRLLDPQCKAKMRNIQTNVAGSSK
jgi:hypothetical protein